MNHELTRPDIQLHYVCAGGHNDAIMTNIGVESIDLLKYKYGFTTLPTLLHPKSTGTITLASSDPFAAPLIDPRYLSHPEDIRALVEGLKVARKIHLSPAFDGIRGAELLDVELAESFGPATDAYFVELVRRAAITVCHPVGTCKMGKDEMAVVDPRCRVIGFKRLRVVDCSIFPEVRISLHVGATHQRPPLSGTKRKY